MLWVRVQEMAFEPQIPRKALFRALQSFELNAVEKRSGAAQIRTRVK